MVNSIYHYFYVGIIMGLGILSLGKVDKFYNDQGIKFVRINTNIGPVYINCNNIIAIGKTNVIGQEGKTQINLGFVSYYTSDAMEDIIEKIIEK
jgi:hypothetical protein